MAVAFASVWFVVANVALSMLAILLWRGLRGAAPRAGTLFLLRMLPAIGSAALVLGIVLPSFLFFEPDATAERAGPALLVFVALAYALVAAGLTRAVSSWQKTRRFAKAWQAVGERSGSLTATVPMYRVPTELPLAALVGVIRPRLFISDVFADALSAEERQAVLDHEAGHALSRDNFKRIAMSLAPDWLSLLPAAREIESAWAIASEEEADDHASGEGRAHALDLAGALLKASRMVPIHAEHVSHFCDDAMIARRIARLLNDDPRKVRDASFSARARIAWVLAGVTVVLLLAGPGFPAAYAMTEAAVRLLQ